jgi:hypothetical protein
MGQFTDHKQSTSIFSALGVCVSNVDCKVNIDNFPYLKDYNSEILEIELKEDLDP